MSAAKMFERWSKIRAWLNVSTDLLAERYGGLVGDTGYYVDKLEDCARQWIATCPVQVGDRVRLVVCPDPESWGGAVQHWMVVGAEGLVQGIDWYGDRFRAGVIFDDNPDKRPIRGEYWHDVNRLEKVG